MATTESLAVVGRPDGLPVIGPGEPLEAAAVLVDKPGGMSSFGVVKKVRWALGVKKVGHAGTLDPMATGLLIVLVGRGATRQQDRFMGATQGLHRHHPAGGDHGLIRRGDARRFGN